MNTRKVPSLGDALAEVAEFRQVRGRRYELMSVLVLCYVAVMRGNRSQAAIAEWRREYRGGNSSLCGTSGFSFGSRWAKSSRMNRLWLFLVSSPIGFAASIA